jgi:predicted nucleic acid-binding protein
MQYLVETDILREYLTHKGQELSLLRQALSSGTCYTSMVNAMEIFSEMTGERERAAASNMLLVVRVLGFNARFAEPFAHMAKEHAGLTQREMLVLGMAKASKLTVLTSEHFDRYAALGVVPVVSAVEAVPANIS